MGGWSPGCWSAKAVKIPGRDIGRGRQEWLPSAIFAAFGWGTTYTETPVQNQENRASRDGK